ncbi:MAG: hypothetical protein ACREYA_34535 [Cupriavidus necator]
MAPRTHLATLLQQLHHQAATEAETSWARSKGPMASYWLAVAIHAKRAARVLGSTS